MDTFLLIISVLIILYCESDDIRCVQDQALPAIARTYALDLSVLRELRTRQVLL